MTMHRQRGSALVTGLVFLVVIIMLGLSASSGSIQQELGVRSLRDQNLAMEAAEAALRAGETWLRYNTGPVPIEYDPVVGSKLVRVWGYCDPAAQNCAEAGSRFWIDNGEVLGENFDRTPTLKLVAEQPRFIIEFKYCDRCDAFSQSNRDKTKYYRITARGVGMNEKTDRIVQSIYRY